MSVFFVHCDVRAADLSFLPPGFEGADVGEALSMAALEEIRSIAEHCDLVFPAYNYGFTNSGRFSAATDTPQVGRLSRFLFDSSDFERTSTPVFSHFHSAILDSIESSPFSSESAFGILAEKEGKILLFGTKLKALTFIHHIEHLAGIPYRYEKTFPGKVIIDGIEHDWDVTFHVRPKGLVLSYDREQLLKTLTESQLLSSPREGLWVIPAQELRDLLLGKLKFDPLWMLDRSSKDEVDRLLENLGRPFCLQDFEITPE